MTTTELIAKLQEMPPHAQVNIKVDIPIGELRIVGFFKTIKPYFVNDKNTVTLRGRSE